jgi:hypothetical protein
MDTIVPELAAAFSGSRGAVSLGPITREALQMRRRRYYVADTALQMKRCKTPHLRRFT